MIDIKNLNIQEGKWNLDHLNTVLTFCMCTLMRSFQAVGLSSCCNSVAGTPPLGQDLDLSPSSAEIPHTFQNPETDQLPAARCQMLSHCCRYRHAQACASDTGLFSQLLKPFAHWEEMRNWRVFFISHSFVLPLSHLIFWFLIFQLVPVFFLCVGVGVWLFLMSICQSCVKRFCVSVTALFQDQQKGVFLYYSVVTASSKEQITIFHSNQTVSWC